MAKVTRAFSLDTEADRDILRWLERQENGSAAIRQAIRALVGSGGVTIGDVYQAVKELDRKIQAGVVVGVPAESPAPGWPPEPPDAAAALDALGL